MSHELKCTFVVNLKGRSWPSIGQPKEMDARVRVVSPIKYPSYKQPSNMRFAFVVSP